MNFLELVKERYSVRIFEDKKIPDNVLESILEAGTVAPTAANFQPQRIVVLNNREALDKIKTTTTYHFNAPCVLLICFDKNVSWKHPESKVDQGMVDASIVTTHMMLMAKTLGIGSTWVAVFNEQLVREEFNLPSNIVPVSLMPMGYYSADSKPSKMHFERLSKEKTIAYNKFDFQ